MNTDTNRADAHDSDDLKPLLTQLIAMVADLAQDVTAIRHGIAEIKTVQTRQSTRLADLDARLDSDSQNIDSLIRP